MNPASNAAAFLRPERRVVTPVWVAVWTRARAEKAVAQTLDARAIPVWLPTLTLRRRWSDRWRDVEFPAFPGYLFAQVAMQEWHRLLVPGVLTLVKQGRDPSVIPNGQIGELRDLIARLHRAPESEVAVETFEPGDRVRVMEGLMAGLVGVVIERRGNRRLQVGFQQVGRAISVTIGAAAVERCA